MQENLQYKQNLSDAYRDILVCEEVVHCRIWMPLQVGFDRKQGMKGCFHVKLEASCVEQHSLCCGNCLQIPLVEFWAPHFAHFLPFKPAPVNVCAMLQFPLLVTEKLLHPANVPSCY